MNLDGTVGNMEDENNFHFPILMSVQPLISFSIDHEEFLAKVPSVVTSNKVEKINVRVYTRSCMRFKWLNHGADMSNVRGANREVLINRLTIRNFLLKWAFFGGKDISATPAVANGVYFPSWSGYLYAINAFNGVLMWKQNLSQLTGLNGIGIGVKVTLSRSTPTIANDLLFIGIYGPAVVTVVTRFSGRLVWSAQLDPRPRVQITQPGTFYMGLNSQYTDYARPSYLSERKDFPEFILVCGSPVECGYRHSGSDVGDFAPDKKTSSFGCRHLGLWLEKKEDGW
ncbi:unnamed protein product [Dovyalis caffra]|uniref:Uncharacterized protein n=1 Tax=Dovyalis caffra TaxID=77055 RepID=A0AAV1S033_9ROSI|nr:unnamed protein product [Dovyalis caffra]